jgi:hypothetical protein
VGKQKNLPQPKKAKGHEFNLGIVLHFVNTVPNVGVANSQVPHQIALLLTVLEKKGWITVTHPRPDTTLPRLTETGHAAIARFMEYGTFHHPK